jgi:DNA-binding GntR family transcriptional regulator
MVDPYGPETLRDQVAALIREQISRGELAPRDWLPSETDLSQAYDVSRDTVRAALALLRDEGLITSRKGRGWFVTG